VPIGRAAGAALLVLIPGDSASRVLLLSHMLAGALQCKLYISCHHVTASKLFQALHLRALAVAVPSSKQASQQTSKQTV
jgi:hypothetical protein